MGADCLTGVSMFGFQGVWVGYTLGNRNDNNDFYSYELSSATFGD